MGAGTTLRAVIFDLDDTLIDTTGLLLGPAHLEAARAMIAAGLDGVVEEVAHARVAFTRTHPGDDLEALLIERFGASDPDRVRAAGRAAFYCRPVPDIDPIPGSLELLASLRSSGYLLFLLTIGDPDTQRRKVELAGLAEAFDTLVLVDIESSDKAAALEVLLGDHALEPEQVLVVGDRIDREIEAGRRSGCWTLRVIHGEGRYYRPQSPAQQAHYTVDEVQSIPAVIADIEQGGGGPGTALEDLS